MKACLMGTRMADGLVAKSVDAMADAMGDYWVDSSVDNWACPQVDAKVENLVRLLVIQRAAMSVHEKARMMVRCSVPQSVSSGIA